MIIRCYLFLILIIFCGYQTEVSSDSHQVVQMESKTLIQLINFSRTLIQDGEIHFLLYASDPSPPEGPTRHQHMMSMWEKQLQENPPESKDLEATRQLILKYIEGEKKYGKFVDSKEFFGFQEGHVVFQVPQQQKMEQSFEIAYRMAIINRFENFPSFEHNRFCGAGYQYNLFSNVSGQLKGSFPSQFSNKANHGYFVREDAGWEPHVISLHYLPPINSIDETTAEVHLSQTDTGGGRVYTITDYPFERTKVKIYVRLKNKLPEVFREEYYYQSDSPHADEEGYWLRVVNQYRDFERIPDLNIAFPKVREEQEFRAVDRFMRFHTIITIKEMDFNLGLPTNFFDWNEAELNADDGFIKHISESRVSITGAYVHQEGTK